MLKSIISRHTVGHPVPFQDDLLSICKRWAYSSYFDLVLDTHRSL